MIRKIVFIFLLLPFFSFGQNTTKSESQNLPGDTSDFPYIRERINDETFFLKNNPTAQHYFNRANMKMKLADYTGANADLEKAIALEPKGMFAYYLMGAVKERLNNYPESITNYTKAIDLQPDYEWAWNDRAQTYIKMKKYKEAEADLRKALQLKPDFAQAVFNLGLLNDEQKNYPKALEYYSKNLKMDSTHFVTYNNMGAIYFQMQKYDLAIANYTSALRIYPKYFSALRSRANAKLKKNDKDGACKDLQTAADMGDEKAALSLRQYCGKK